MRGLLILIPLITGCETLRLFSPRDPDLIAKPGQISPRDLRAAARLDAVGRQILATNPLLPTAPAFCFVGSAGKELFHQNAEAVFVSEGLITACATDDELAALLCTEVARIAVEYRNLARLGLPEPDTTLPGARNPDDEEPELGGAQSVGQGNDFKKKAKLLPSSSATDFAKELHRNAGYQPESFGKISSLLSEADKTHSIAKQFSGPANPPRWSR